MQQCSTAATWYDQHCRTRL